MSHAQTAAVTQRHRIAVLALEHMMPLEICMPFVVFGAPHLAYDVVLCGRQAGLVPTDHGWPIVVELGLDAVAVADTVIVPAFRGFLDSVPDDVAEALRAAHGNGARIASICTGAFALAAAGLLDGKRATTHWCHADELSCRYPVAEIDPGVLFVDSGDVLTSAGVVSGIDLCLHLLRSDRGAAVANDIARTIVAAPYRDGGQAQFIHAAGGRGGLRRYRSHSGVGAGAPSRAADRRRSRRSRQDSAANIRAAIHRRTGRHAHPMAQQCTHRPRSRATGVHRLDHRIHQQPVRPRQPRELPSALPPRYGNQPARVSKGVYPRPSRRCFTLSLRRDVDLMID